MAALPETALPAFFGLQDVNPKATAHISPAVSSFLFKFFMF
jgi:hypothetical protein